MRVPEALSRMRANASIPEVVNTLYELCAQIYAKHGITEPSQVCYSSETIVIVFQIWNADETGKNGSEEGVTKVLAPKGAKNVYKRGHPKQKHVTIMGTYTTLHSPT